MVNLLPENAYQYARFLVGNKITNMFGVSVDGFSVRTERFSEDQLGVLRSAVENARADGRSYVEYRDYPAMKDGTRPENFYSGKRQEQSDLDLYVKSATDPVFEMFTLVGGFTFKDNEDGGFAIDDHYGFDKSKSIESKRANPMDAYAERVYEAQDVNQTYNFSIKGNIPPAGKSFEGYDYASNVFRGIYNTISNTFNSLGEIKTDDVPLEFMIAAREKLDNFFSANQDASVVSFDELGMPDVEEMPSVMQYFAARQTRDGGYQIFDKFKVFAEDTGGALGPMLDIDIKVPPADRVIGNIPDIPVDLGVRNPTLPNALLSNERLQQATTTIKDRIYNRNDDDLSFSDAFAKNRKTGAETFKWRGGDYTTLYAEEVANG